MSAYGGYQRTGYGAQGGEDGGGFVSGSQQGSQAGQKRNTDEYLRPVTIKQLIDSNKASYNEADVQIDGMPVTQVTVVGQVRAVNPQATNVTFKLDDGTATIDVKKWLDAGKSGGEDEVARFPLDTYVRVLGRIQSFNGKVHIGAHHMRAIEDFNEVNYHLLEATYVHLLLTKGGSAKTGGGGGDGDPNASMFVDQGNGYNAGGGGGYGGEDSRVAMCSRQAQQLYRWYQSAQGNTDGINIRDVVAGTKMSTRDVQAAADELLGHGLVYTTVDEETWAILEV
ncbi:replication factor A protein 2 [Podospora australis]|uniref:Replication factor A protein 2 n=1 Tax=Podospora australis TaxID=1536484 RepID=A0AAN6X461_9PEZI|nr:replication factor A protein 2 [Podospora australis]